MIDLIPVPIFRYFSLLYWANCLYKEIFVINGLQKESKAIF
jgi:hypothetical protein